MAGVLGLEWFLRKADNQSKRLLFLLDARAVLGAFARGRSSDPTLFPAVRKAAALHLAGDLVVRWVNITSESNPADAPSRGLRKEKVSHHKLMSPRANQTITKPHSVPDWHDNYLSECFTQKGYLFVTTSDSHVKFTMLFFNERLGSRCTLEVYPGVVGWSTSLSLSGSSFASVGCKRTQTAPSWK